ncbi:MAG: hypothetical protein NTV49_05235 [Kiritimatiellaeota bacterium]|nr:hypothetical protein [Kiritimatiellota bacterium]
MNRKKNPRGGGKVEPAKQQSANRAAPIEIECFWGTPFGSDGNVYFPHPKQPPPERLPLYLPPFFQSDLPGWTADKSAERREFHFTMLLQSLRDFRKIRQHKKPVGAFKEIVSDTIGLALQEQHAERGDQEAARHVLEVATFAAETLERLLRKRPDLFKGIIEDAEFCPVLAGVNTDWATQARELLDDVGFGHNVHEWRSEKGLSEKAWDETTSVTRRWALHCFNILDRNCEIMHLLDDQPKAAMRYLRQKYPWVQWIPPPDWVRSSKTLPPFSPSEKALKKWGTVLSAMLDAECPEFWKSPAWRDTWSRKEFQRVAGKIAPDTSADDMVRFFKKCGGLIRSRCLSDIKNELARLASKPDSQDTTKTTEN